MKRRVTKSFQGRILLISIMGTIACILSCGMISFVTIQSIGQHRMRSAMEANLDRELNHLESSYFTMVRMMLQMRADGTIGSVLEDYLNAENNFDKYLLKRELENEIASITFLNQYVNLAVYVDSETGADLFGNDALNGVNFTSSGCLAVIGDNQFQVIHRSASMYNKSIVISMLREGERFGGRPYDIYLEMKTNIPEYSLSSSSTAFLSLQLDEQGNVLFCNGEEFAPGDTLTLSLDDSGSFAGVYRNYYLVAKRSSLGFLYVNGMPNSVYRKEIIGWYERLVVLCILSVIPAFLIMFNIKRMLGDPINRLEREIIEVGKGQLELVNEDIDVPEFRELMHEINEMKVHIKELLKTVQEKEKQRQETEREKLMYQINPHFLLNTLNSVQWMAQLDKQEDISRFVADFKQLLAYNLGKEETTSTLRTEVKIAQKYISLQKQRYDFDATLEVEEGAYLDTETVRMLLQPLIENALRYGLGERSVVELRIFYDDRRGYAVITLQDYGNGLSREKLEQLNRPFQYEGNGREENAGIGLRYVRHCLEGFYDGEAILTINSELGRGTKVTIMIPVPEARDEECYD